MNGPPPGKVRSPGINILLFVVTLGVYWFVWMYKAFNEVARSRGRDIKAGMWVALLAVVWAVGIVVASVAGISTFLEQMEEQGEGATAPPPTFEELFQPEYTPLTISAMVVSVVFYLLQLFYLRNANVVVNEVLVSAGLPPGPAPALALAFNLLYIVGQVPLIGIVASLGGLVVAILWVVQIQGAINRYWQPRGYGQPMPPPSAGSPMTGWTPAAPASPPQAPPPMPPPRR